MSTPASPPQADTDTPGPADKLDKPNKPARRKMTVKRQLVRLGVLLAGAYLLGVILSVGFINQIMYQPPTASYSDDAGIIKLTTADGVQISAMHLQNPATHHTIPHSRGNGEDMGQMEPSMGFTNKIMYQPPAASYTDDAGILKLTTADGVRISAIHLQNPAVRYTILYSHGNGEDMGQMEPYYRMFESNGYNVLAYDYHGYGTSEGSPSEQATYADIDAAYDYLMRSGVEPERILLLGRSIGCGPATDLATRKPVGGLILESGFTSAFRVATRWPIFPGDRYRNLEKLPNVHCPVLFIHGREDRLLPLWHAKKNWQAVHSPKQYYWVDDAGHNDLMLVAGTKYFDVLNDFVKLVQEHTTSDKSTPK